MVIPPSPCKKVRGRAKEKMPPPSPQIGYNAPIKCFLCICKKVDSFFFACQLIPSLREGGGGGQRGMCPLAIGYGDCIA